MTLGEFIKRYRADYDLSVRAFASMVDMSPQQIINIEKGIGNDGKPMTSTMKTYSKIAKGIRMDEREFLNMLNDTVVVNPSSKKISVTLTDDGQNVIGIPYPTLSDEDKSVLDWYHSQSEETKRLILSFRDAQGKKP